MELLTNDPTRRLLLLITDSQGNIKGTWFLASDNGIGVARACVVEGPEQLTGVGHLGGVPHRALIAFTVQLAQAVPVLRASLPATSTVRNALPTCTDQ